MDEDDDKQHFSLQSIQEAESVNKRKKKKKLRDMKKKKAEGETQDLQDDFKVKLVIFSCKLSQKYLDIDL